MNVDKFGHYIHKRMRLSEIFDFNEALLKSENGEFNLKKSRLRGIKSPVETDDAVNKNYVDQINADMVRELNKLIGSLRSQIILDIHKIAQNTLKAKIPEVLTQLEDKFYTKAEVNKLIEKSL